MLPALLGRPEGIRIVKFAHLGAVVLATAICGYFLLTLTPEVRALSRSRHSLGKLKHEIVELNERTRAVRREQAGAPPISGASLDAFAIQAATWAKSRHIWIESLVPEGVSGVVEANVGDRSVGKWSATRATLCGRGRFEHVIGFLGELTDIQMPVQLETFSLQAEGGGTTGSVEFQITLTLYEPCKAEQ